MAAGPVRADDPAPVVTIADATVVEGNGKGETIRFPITASGYTGNLTLVVATRPESATASDDFTPRLSVFTIPSLGGPNTNYSFEVPIVSDQVFEPTESFSVAYRVITPGDPVPAPGTPGVNGAPDLASEATAATGTITDDDAPASKPAAGPSPTMSAPPAPASVPVPVPVKATSKPTFTSVAKLPSTNQCVSRRLFRIRLRSPKNARIAAATVKLRGTVVATRSGKRVTAPIDLRGLPKGRFTVAIKITLADGRIVSGSRKYRTCATRRAGSSKPKV